MNNSVFNEYLEWINSRNENFPYINPAPRLKVSSLITEEQIPIVASGIKYRTDQDPYEEWEGSIPKDNRHLDKESLQKAKNAGFNICMQASLSDESKNHINIYTSLNNASEVGVKLMFFSGNLINDKDFFLKVLQNKGYAGFKLRDEPNYKELVGENDSLWTQYRALMENNGNYVPFVYINLVGYPSDELLPDFIPEHSTDDETILEILYKEYLEAYQKFFKPALFSYDLYPFYEIVNLVYEGINLPPKPVKEGTIGVNYDIFYKRLRQYLDISQKHNRPFWAYCESNCYMSLKEERGFQPIALEQYIRFEAFSALAYGAKGIVYWTFAAQETNSENAYFSALTNRRNEKTASWHFAKNVNEEIQKYKDVFLVSDLMEVSESYEYSYECKDAGVQVFSNKRQDVIISRLNNGTSTFLIVVSKDALDYGDINIIVNHGQVYELTPKKSRGEENMPLELGANWRTMIPGGYRIFWFSDPIKIEPIE